MSIITIDGQIGAGAPEVGRRVAKTLRIDYYDRLILAGVAKRLGATVAAVQEKEQRIHKLSDKLRSLVEMAMNSLAMSAGTGDPYFGGLYADALPLTWDESPYGPRTFAHQLKNVEIATATGAQLEEIASYGNAVIVHRAGCVELGGRTQTLRVGLFAPKRERIWRVMTREGFLRPEHAEKAIEDRERSQIAYFGENYGVHPHDEDLYDLRLTTGTSGLDLVALKIAHLVRDENVTGITAV